MDITIGNSSSVIVKAQAIRFQVFTVEQQISNELDFDGLDEQAAHLLAVEQGQPIATARLCINTDGSSVMARVAVIEEYRGRGVASVVVKTLMEYAETQGVSSIEIHAHNYLRRFYEGFGFEFIQEVEIVSGHQLIEMRYQRIRT